MKRSLVILSTAIITLALMIGVVGASNDYLAGNDDTDRAYVDGRTNFYLVDTNNPFAYDAEISDWTIYAGRTSPVGFMIYRYDGTNWSVIYDGSGDLQTPVLGINSYPLSPSVQVQAGDYVGIFSGSSAGAVDFDKPSGEPFDRGDLTGRVLFTGAGAGATAFSGSSDRIYSVNAQGSILVDIDIKPGSDPNSINLGSNGVIPVAILTTETFDAANVDPTTVSLEGADVKVRGKADKLMAHMEDVDGDGDLDLVVQVENETSLTEGASLATLTGYTYDGLAFSGTDSIRVVP